MRWSCAIALFAALIFLFTGCAALPPKPSPRERMTIAVVGMRDGALDRKIINMLTTALIKDDYFTVVEYETLERVLREKKFQLADVVNPETAVRIGSELRAQAIVKSEVVSQRMTVMPIPVGTVAWRSITVTSQVLDSRTGKTILAVSETGRSYAGAGNVSFTWGGQTRDDVVSMKRTEEDMFNAAIRDALEKAARSIVMGIYGNRRSDDVMMVEARPNPSIEALTARFADSNHFAARARAYYVPYDVVWAATTRYLKREKVSEDRSRGVISAERSDSEFHGRTVFVIDKVFAEATRVTVKAFCYTRVSTGWQAGSPDLCSDISLNGVRNNIRDLMKEWPR